MRQRGLSLVEIAIILAVVGLLIGAGIVPIRQLLKSEAYDEEEARMRGNQHAILGYALTHTTRERQVTVLSRTGNVNITYTVPGGRPYLPCPDISGDGYEDRQGAAAVGEFASTADYTIDTAVGGTNPLLSEGNCVLNRGNLPWKTLGVEASDYWGNRYTYEVDDVFSNAIVGFNQDTLVDAFDQRHPVPVANTVYYTARAGQVVILTLTLNVGGTPTPTPYSYLPLRRPILICDEGNTLCQSDVGATFTNLTLAAGSQAGVSVTVARRQYEPGHVIEGAVYAIVSHGANGNGAVNHVVSGSGVPRCNAPINTASATATPTSVEQALWDEMVNFPFPDSPPPSPHYLCQPVLAGATGTIASGFFVSAPRSYVGGAGGREYDDIVVWAMRAELLQVLTAAQKLPAPELPLFRTY